MIEDTGRRVCDKEIFSTAKKVWVGCRKPAPFNVASAYTASGIDFCKCHAPKTALMAPVPEGWSRVES